MQIGEVCLETNDVVRLAEFYRTLFDIPGKDEDVVHQCIPTEGTSLTIFNSGARKRNDNENISLAFTVENVDEKYERLKQLGVVIVEAPTTRPWGARNMHFKDPDGNHIYFRSFSSRD